MRKLLAILIAVALIAAYQHWQQRPVVHSPGVLVTQDPVQRNVSDPVKFQLEEFAITPRAEFDIQARVLGRETYYFGTEAELSPIDLALGWKKMSDQSVLDQIDIRQGGRWYFTRYDLPPPISEQEIISNSANMHMIPADRLTARELKSIRPGEVIRIRGFLVDVDHESGWKWRTSMTRSDSGKGACELIYVEDVLRMSDF